MSTKKQISTLCKLHSVYEEIPEEFLDGTDVVSYFYRNNLYISPSHHQIVWVSKRSNKKYFAFKVFHFGDLKLQQRFILKEEVSISKKESETLLDSLDDILKAFDQANKAKQIPLPNLNLRLDFQKQKTNCSVIVTRIILSVWPDKFGCRSALKRTRLASFPSKSLNITVNTSFLQKLSTWVTVKSNISTRTNFLLLTSATFTICSALRCLAHSPLIVGTTTSLLFSLGTCIVRIQIVRVNFACTRRLFNLSAEAIINVRNARLCPRCAIFLLKIKKIPFSCRLVKGFTFLKRAQNQFKVLLEMCIVLASIV